MWWYDIGLLLATRADVDKQDNDGWTPLHAAARWGQKEAAQMLVTSLADMDIKNHAGQTPIDVADPGLVKFLEELYKNCKRTAKRRPASQIRISDNLYSHIIETPQKVIRVEMKNTDTKNIDGGFAFAIIFYKINYSVLSRSIFIARYRGYSEKRSSTNCQRKPTDWRWSTMASADLSSSQSNKSKRKSTKNTYVTNS